MSCRELIVILIKLVVISNSNVEGRTLWSQSEFVPKNYSSGFNVLPEGEFDHGSGSVVKDPYGGSNQVLKVFYKAGNHWTKGQPEGLSFYSKPILPRDDMTLTFDLFFDRDFDFSEKGYLPGLFGGALNCYVGRYHNNCFSARFNWLSEGYGQIGALIPHFHHQAPECCNQTTCNSTKAYPLGSKSWSFQRGEWQTISQKVHLNTPGETDGSIEVWYNRRLVYAIYNLTLRTSSSIHIDGIFFSAFFSELHSPPTRDCYSFFKNVVLSDGFPHYTLIG